MATIITVHGTFANDGSAPASGADVAWWQNGSEFEKDLARWVEPEDERLKMEPFVWDGRNSEESRYAAARELHGRISSLEKAGEDYVLVGHSHGGSVIALALSLAVSRKQQLAGLKRWITVGTPFIEFKEKRFLFSKLSLMAKSAYLILAYIAMGYLAFVLSGFIGEDGFDNPDFDRIILSAGLLLLASCYVALHRFRSDKIKLLKSASSGDFERALGSKWLSLWHKGDEAVQGFKLIKTIRIAPFRPEFAVPVISSFSIVAGPLILYVLLGNISYENLVADIQNWTEFAPTDDAEPLEEFARNTLAILASPSRLIFELAEYVGLHDIGSSWVNQAVLFGALLVGSLLGFGVLWLFSLIVYLAFFIGSKYVSGFISSALNRAAATQLRRRLFGEDTLGEVAVGASEAPAWLAARSAPLPASLSDEISARSDSAATASISEIRRALSTFAFAEQDGDLAAALSRYLTWDELIHTTYFRVSPFRKLVAFAICRSPGFAASAAFRADAQWHDLALWYAALAAAATPDNVTALPAVAIH